MMFTNIFRIGGLQTVTWFQLMPLREDSTLSNLSSWKTVGSEESLTRSLLSVHIQLQNAGHLSSWTLCPSEKGRKVKLWLFSPGRLERPSLEICCKVIKSGIWQSPGNSSEVTTALCRALRNRFEKAVSTLAYVRYGEMFVKCKRQITSDSDFRKSLPSCEITFFASEEAVVLCIRVRKRRIRPLAASDIRAVITSSTSQAALEKPAVIVAPYGLTGWLSGCCPGDLVRQLTQSKMDLSREHGIRQSPPSCSSRSCYVEVRMQFLLAKAQKPEASRRFLKNGEVPREDSHWIEKLFVFPSEAVLVPTVPPVPANTYLKRCWLRNLGGTDWIEDALSLRGFSPLSSLYGHRLQAMGKSNTIWKLSTNCSKSSKSSTSSGSGGSSIKSSDSRGSSGSESDVNDGEYREDADSAATKAGKPADSRRSGASLKRGRELGKNNATSKSSRKGSPGALSVINESNVAGSRSAVETPYWNEELNEVEFLAEFGDFGDFFEDDGFGFGEPPDTAESCTPGTQYLDASDPSLLPIVDFSMLEGFGQLDEMDKKQVPGGVEDSKGDITSPSTAVPAHISAIARSEASLLFAFDYAPVELPSQKSFLDKIPAYKAQGNASKSDSVGVRYRATPPSSPKAEAYERKPEFRFDMEDVRKVNPPSELTSVKAENRSSGLQTPIVTLATDLECAMFQIQLYDVRGVAYCAPLSEPSKPLDSSHKECSSGITDSSDCDNPLKKPRKVPVPERIAGYAEEVVHDGPKRVEVGVWRPVEMPKPQEVSCKEAAGVCENGNAQEALEILPLLVQQASSTNDIALFGEHGDGALEWLQLRQQLNHTDARVSMDSCDPSVAEISPATVASILQSDMRQAMGLAFGDLLVSGPLSVAEWCKGKAQPGDSYITGDSKDLVSTITGEPITPPQLIGISKIPLLQELDSSEFRRSREMEEASQRRMPLDTSDMESQSPSYGVLPVPALLVGYQDDWLKTSPSSIKYWEKAPFEPYGHQKPVNYYVLCPAVDALLLSASEFLLQLSNVYEACKLGTHLPGSISTQAGKRAIQGFVEVDVACKLKVPASNSNNMANDYIAAMESGWDLAEFLQSLKQVCKSLTIAGPTAAEEDNEICPSTVVYVVAPTSEPSVVLQTMIQCCHGLRPVLGRAKKILGASSSSEELKQPIAGFSLGTFALQILTPELVLRLGNSGLDVLKEISFTVYNKIRRIPQKSSDQGTAKSRLAMHAPQGALSGLWKDCGRTSGLTILGLDRWEKPWHQPRLIDDAYNTPPLQPSRFLFEPLFILADGCLLEHGTGQLLHSKEKTAEISLSKISGHSLGMTDTLLTAVDTDTKTCQRSCFHCCYTWTMNWEWLIAVWTDTRGELLDVNVLPVPRLVTENAVKDGSCRELFQLFNQVLQQGMQLLTLVTKPHNIVIMRIGDLFECEYQEWQRVFLADDSRTWTVHIHPDENPGSLRNATGLTSLPTSPSTSSFSSRAMLSGFSGIGKSNQLMQSEGNIHGLVQSLALATISLDNSLQVLSMSDSSANGLATGFGMAKTVATSNGAYLFVPAYGVRSLGSPDSTACKLPTAAIAQLLQSRGLAHPVASGYVVSGASRPELPQGSIEEEWPSTLHVGLVAYFGNSNRSGRQDSNMRLGGSEPITGKHGNRAEARCVLEQLAVDMYALSWLTVSPTYLHRRHPFPFHCDVAQRLDKLLCYVSSGNDPLKL